jgi:hypothetical protein
MLDGPALLGIETFQILIGIFSEHESPHVDPRIDRFEPARNEGGRNKCTRNRLIQAARFEFSRERPIRLRA